MKLADLDVLVVDDHEAMRVLLTRVLSRAGVTRIRNASGGEQALIALAERPANLILADQNMPGMGGLAFVRAVRADPVLAIARVLMVTGAASKDHADAARAAGADKLLVKPVTARDLLAAIEELFAV